MKNAWFYLLLFVAVSGNGVAQEYGSDTIFVRHPKNWQSRSMDYTVDTVYLESYNHKLMMAGTAIIPYTHDQLNVYGTYQLMLKDVAASDCQSHGEEVYNSSDRINFITETDSTFIVDITIYDNCCYNFLCDASVVEGGILNLKYTGYGTMYCGCNCCFGLTYTFEKEDLPREEELKAMTINGESDTYKPLQQLR